MPAPNLQKVHNLFTVNWGFLKMDSNVRLNDFSTKKFKNDFFSLDVVEVVNNQW